MTEKYNGWKYKTAEEAAEAKKARLRANSRKWYHKHKHERGLVKSTPEELAAMNIPIMKDEKETIKKEEPITISPEAEQGANEGGSPLIDLMKDLGVPHVEKVVKYLPAAMNLINKLSSMKAEQQNTQQKNKEIPTMPPGYGTLKAMNYKNDPVWQAQSEAWRKYTQGNNYVVPNVAPAHDPTLRPEKMPVADDSNLKKPDWGMTKEEIINDEEKTEVLSKEEEENNNKMIKQLDIVFGYLNSMTKEQFTKWMNKPKELKSMVDKVPFMMFPELEAVLKQTSGKELLETLKIRTPEKYMIIEKEKKLEAFEDLWEETKKSKWGIAEDATKKVEK